MQPLCHGGRCNSLYCTPSLLCYTAAMNTPRPTPASTEPDAHAQAAEDAHAHDDASEPTPTKKPRLEPTRYGDWELNGKCVDF
jgi:hypothetical protein